MIESRKRNWTATARPIVLAAFAAFVLVTAIRHHTSAGHEPSLHAYCPFGVIASLWPLITTGRLARTLHASGAVLGAGVLLSAFVVGGAFCGWICPLGALHDALDWIRRKLRIREIKLPRLLNRALRFGRYAMLIGIIFATAATTDRLWFGDYDPYHAIFALDWIFAPNLAEHWRAYVVSVAVVAGGLFIPRLWCRYLCPLGGLLSLVQRISPIKIRRNANVCVDCGRCDRACPMRLSVASGGAVASDCVMCLRCVEDCPVPGALETALPGYQTLATTPKESAS